MAYQEPTKEAIEREAQELRVFGGFQVTIEQTRDRVCESLGWVDWNHMCKCKATRGAA